MHQTSIDAGDAVILLAALALLARTLIRLAAVATDSRETDADGRGGHTRHGARS